MAREKGTSIPCITIITLNINELTQCVKTHCVTKFKNRAIVFCLKDICFMNKNTNRMGMPQNIQSVYYINKRKGKKHTIIMGSKHI